MAVIGDVKNVVANILKQKAKRKILLALAKTAPLWGPVVIFFLAGLFIFLSVYGAMCSDTDLSADGYVTEVDQAMKEIYVEAAEKHSGEAISVGALEKDHAIPWGLLYSLDFFDSEINEKQLTNTADETGQILKPYFTYKDSTIRKVTRRKVTVTNEDGSTSTKTETDVDEYDVKLLITADTYKGFYRYSYERRTTTEHPDEDTTIKITKDHLTGIDYKEDWSRLESEMAKRGMKVNNLERQMLVELGDGFTREDLALEWLLDPPYLKLAGAYIGEIPDEYLEWFKEAGDEYGIPWYILAAVAKIESTFNPEAIGSKNDTGELAQGLMQFLPSTWQKYGVDADGDGEANPFNPKDAIFSAANYLRALGGTDDIRKALYGYNHSWSYADKIIALGEAYKTQDAFGGGDYIFPLTVPMNITSPFGRSETRSSHHGVDFGAPTGTPIMSVIDGTIELKEYHSIYGNHIRIRGIDGNLYEYAHMASYSEGMRVGREVKQGTVIGYVGSTGRSTGPHLHFGVQAAGKWIDPLLILLR